MAATQGPQGQSLGDTTATPSSRYGVNPGPGKAKLHGRAFYESLGSPKYVVAPMVAQSEFVSLECALPIACNAKH